MPVLTSQGIEKKPFSFPNRRVCILACDSMVLTHRHNTADEPLGHPISQLRFKEFSESCTALGPGLGVAFPVVSAFPPPSSQLQELEVTIARPLRR